MKKIYANEKYCLNCKLCQVHCKTAHSISKDIIKAHKNENILPRIKIEGNDIRSFAFNCRQCDEPACVNACITGSMFKDRETGVVVNIKERCVGCLSCVAACPYGTIIIADVVSKCDLCAEIGEPACVKNCPNNALEYKEEEEK